MRLLHIADLHVGKRVCEFPMLADQRHVLAQVVSLLRSRSCDALLVAGDVYDKSAPSAESVALVDWFLGEVAATGVPAVVIPGNHDSAERIAYARGPLGRLGVHVAPVYEGHVEPVELRDEWGGVSVWPLPFVRPATVRHALGDPAPETYTDALRRMVGELDLSAAGRNVAVAHQFVTSGSAVPERCDSEVSVGGLDNVDASVFDGFDYVALGHVHRAQRVGRCAVRYAGSILKYSVSEATGTKTATLVDLGAPGSTPSIELVPLDPLHDLRRIRGPLESLVSPEVVGAADANDYLHVVLTDENPAMDAMARLRSHYPNVMSLEYDNARTRSAGLEGGVGVRPQDNASPLDMFCEFYEWQNGAAPSEQQRSIVVEELERIGVLQ